MATKLQTFDLPTQNLFSNLIAFNIGVELGQILALSVLLLFMTVWRKSPHFTRHAFTVNTWLMAAGFTLIGFQLTGFFLA
ncbi:HupE/UreJ family protein [Magnetococcus sp. PR-3]